MSVFDKLDKFLRPEKGAGGVSPAAGAAGVPGIAGGVGAPGAGTVGVPGAGMGGTMGGVMGGVMGGAALNGGTPALNPQMSAAAMQDRGNQAELAKLALNNIRDGVIMTDANGAIRFINSAAVVMTGCGKADDVVGFSYDLVFRLANSEGAELKDEQNPLLMALREGKLFDSRELIVIPMKGDRRFPVALNLLIPVGGSERIITFRDITQELKTESEQADFISTASHEMRTPVASIEGFLGLALNEQTATIDERARGYLTKAHDASVHLGHLFQDLLDVTKLDDHRLKPTLAPINVTMLLQEIVDSASEQFRAKGLTGSFGPDGLRADKRLEQPVFAYLDETFLREIMNNLIDNAIKYTPSGGSVWINVRGDGDRLLINVTDSGIGISQEDLGHIFQKFYRADNSETRTSSGTGLGLYLVRERVLAMGGKVWAESSFGDGSTFYVSLPRISAEEYEKRRLALTNSPIAVV